MSNHPNPSSAATVTALPENFDWMQNQARGRREQALAVRATFAGLARRARRALAPKASAHAAEAGRATADACGAHA